MLILIFVGVIATSFLSALLVGLRAGSGVGASYETTARDTRPHTMKEWHEKCDQWQGPSDVTTINAQLCREEFIVLSKSSR
jgi:hypothetical protein